MTTASPGIPNTPKLKLLSDGMSMVADTTNIYSIKIAIALENSESSPWQSTPPGWRGRLKVVIPTGAGSSDLCTAQQFSSVAISGSNVSVGRESSEFILTPQSSPYVSEETNLMFRIKGIVPNKETGTVSIQIFPGWIGPLDPSGEWSQQTLIYTVTKVAAPDPLEVTGLQWTADTEPPSAEAMGVGRLTWNVTGKARGFAITANYESIIAVISKPVRGKKTWTASTLLEGGDQHVCVTAEDDVGIGATKSLDLTLSGSHGSFTSLKVGLADKKLSDAINLWAPVSLVQTDASERSSSLYGVFQNTSSSTEVAILENSGSGTQNNWTRSSNHDPAVGAPIPSEYVSSPCVYLKGTFYLVLGSAMDKDSPRDQVQRFDGTGWSASDEGQPPIPEPLMGQAVIVHDGHLWVIGGLGASGQVHGSVYRMTPGPPDTWEEMGSLITPLYMASTAVCRDITGKSNAWKLYLFGGYTDILCNDISLTLFECDLGTGSSVPQWSAMAVEFPGGTVGPENPPHYAFIGAIDNTLYAFLDTASGSSTWRYESQDSQWQSVEKYHLQRVLLNPPPKGVLGVSTAPAPANPHTSSRTLFFTQIAGSVAEKSFESVFAYFNPSE